MRQIKFRGRVPENDAFDGGKTVYGYLVVYDSGIYTHWLIRPNKERNCPVLPESVAQLIGYDSNGAEVYEGDKLIDKFGHVTTARIFDNLHADLTLKEAAT